MKYIHFIRCYFSFLGMQNDYLYPFEGQINPESCPFKKPHLWKTRIGFKTAFEISKFWLQ